MTMATFTKKTFNWGDLLRVQRINGRQHGGMKADMVLELRVLYLDQKAARS